MIELSNTKNKKWLKYLDYLSIENYLEGAISSKSSQIGSNITLKEKIEDVNLTNYLRGIELFFEYSEFEDPSEIIEHWNKIRTDEQEIKKFKLSIENYANWLKENGKSDNTCQSYQGHVRGFLKWNNINLKFRNYKPRSQKAKESSRLGITFEDKMDFGFKILDYLDPDLRLFCKILQSTGLGSREVLEWKFKDFRDKDLDKEYIRIDNIRVKTGVYYSTFIMGDLKTELVNYISVNEKKDDNDYIFGFKPNVAYSNMKRRFSRAYDKTIENWKKFDNWKKAKRSIFTFHTYRANFISLCRKLRVPSHIEKRFVAHELSHMDEAYTFTGKDLLENFKLVQNELYGVKTSDSEEMIVNKVFDELKSMIINNGKKESQFKKYNSLVNKNEATSQMKLAFFLNSFESQIKRNILNDKEFLQNLKREMLLL